MSLTHAMESLERVRRAIALKGIDSLPVSFELAGETDLKEFYVGVPARWKPREFKPYVFDIEDYVDEKNSRREDEWGIIWGFGDTLAAGGIPVRFPLRDIDEVVGYEFPDPSGPGRFDSIQKAIEAYSGKYCYVTWIGLLFERLHFLLGFEETLVAFATNPRKVEYALDRIVEFDLALVDSLADSLSGAVHAFASTDDWGGQKNIFIQPELWRKVFKPRYARIAERVHRRGLEFWLHSDGKIEEIIPDLIEIGVDVFNLSTSRLLGIREFGERFAGRSCFCTYIDPQDTAVYGSGSEIVQDARDLVRYWSNDLGSGILAMDYRGNEIYQGLYTQEQILERKKTALTAFKQAFREKTGGGV
jgi:uroporphyrinogen decarboxylase